MKKHLITGTLLLAIAHIALPQTTLNKPATKFDTYQSALDAARKYYYDGDKAQALTIIKQAVDLAKTPDDKFGALARVAQIYTDTDDKAKAMAIWQDIIATEGMSPSDIAIARMGVAGLLISDNKNIEARAELQKLIDNPEDDATYNSALFNYAASYYNEENSDEALRRINLMMDDPRVNFAYKAFATKLAGQSYDKKADLTSARASYVKSLNYFQQAIAAKQVPRAQTKTVYTALLADYEKEYGSEFAQKQAITLFNPLQTEATQLRMAGKYNEALDYYQAIDGINPYLPPLYKLLMREGLGSTLMYSGYFAEGEKILREVADTPVPPDDAKLNGVVQNTRRMLALSYKFEGQVKGGAAEYAKARAELNTLFALPNLDPEVAKRATENLKELNALDPQ